MLSDLKTGHHLSSSTAAVEILGNWHEGSVFTAELWQLGRGTLQKYCEY